MEQQILLTIKKITKPDYQAAADLRHKLWPQDSPSAHLSDIESIFGKAHGGFLAFDGEKAIGFAEVSLRPYVNGCLYRPVGFIEGLYLLPSYETDSARRLLIEACAAWAKAKGAQEMASDAYLENQKSQDELTRMGFQKTEKIVYFRKKL